MTSSAVPPSPATAKTSTDCLRCTPVRQARILLVLCTICAILAATLSGRAVRADAEPVDGIGVQHVQVDAATVTVSGSVGAGGAGKLVDLYALGAETSATISGAEPIARVQVGSDGSFSRSVPRTTEAGVDLLFGQFAAAQDGELVGTGHFADDVKPTADNAGNYPEAASKKGLQVQMTDDAEELGVQHAAINLDLADIMVKKSADAQNTITFTADGVDYYFDKTKVERLDRGIRPLSDRGVLVNLIILLYQHAGDANSAASILIHPDAVTGDGAGPVYGFNTVTAEGRRYLSAAMQFVASRWGSPDSDHGRAVGYIVGNEVNAQWVWSNSGDIRLPDFVDCYARALRLMDLAARKYFDQARTYVSMEHHWTIVPAANPDPANPTRYYTGREFISELNRQITGSGDFDWSVAYHPYPENLFEPDFWNDTTATDDLDTQRITFKNIQVLPRFLDDQAFRYNGEPRRIILSEQGCNTPGSGDALTEQAEELQAACYAYAYYKIKFLPSIDNFILHRHVDHRAEGGLNLGLWAADYSGGQLNDPLRHKYSYDVFKYIDTSRSLEVTDFAKKVIGIKSWADVIPGFDPAELADQPLPTVSGSRSSTRLTGTKSIDDFDQGTDGWRAADNVESVSTDNGGLDVDTAKGTLAEQWRGVVKDFTEPVALGSRRWLAASVTVGKAGIQPEAVIKLKATLADGSVTQGEARVLANGKATTVATRLPAGAKVTRVKIWLRGTGTSRPDPAFSIGSVSMARTASPSTFPNLTITAAADSADLDSATMKLDFTSMADRPLPLTVRSAGCGDFGLQPADDRFTLPAQGSRSRSARIVSATEDAATLCLKINGITFTVPVTIPPPTPHPLYDFDSNLADWQAGDGVTAVHQVGSFANAPGGPHGGTGVLEATGASLPADSERTVSVMPTDPIDLSSARSLSLWLDSYGGAPGATGYGYRITVTGDDGTTVTGNGSMTPDHWNEATVDLSDWAGRTSVTSITVTFHAIGSQTVWAPRFQLDDVAYFD